MESFHINQQIQHSCILTDVDQHGGRDRRQPVPEVDEEAEAFVVLVGWVVQRVRGPHLAPHPRVAQQPRRQRHREVGQAGLPLASPVPSPQLLVVAADVGDVEAQAHLAQGDEDVEVVEDQQALREGGRPGRRREREEEARRADEPHRHGTTNVEEGHRCGLRFAVAVWVDRPGQTYQVWKSKLPT